ncbi:MAG: gamma-glutamyl-gamma-aminobutyrate hydrolase family protein [Firmicutes bacterium]|nr:gamma-glutamyl-gamma-aminobutyrate hydrolase family protein [Bacillota bacterium]
MKNKIGITCSYDYKRSYFFLSHSYFSAIVKAGGVPLLLPAMLDSSHAPAVLENIDALVLTGGGDVDSYLFNEEPHQQQGEVDPPRDHFEIALIREAMKRDLPALCICRGLQVLNVACGGTLYQDLESQRLSPLQHFQRTHRPFPSHSVTIKPKTLLFSILNEKKIRVNSIHHQGIKGLAPELKANARSADGLIEGIEHPGLTFILGVQWHPETLENTPHAQALFRALVEAAKKYNKNSC